MDGKSIIDEAIDLITKWKDAGPPKDRRIYIPRSWMEALKNSGFTRAEEFFRLSPDMVDTEEMKGENDMAYNRILFEKKVVSEEYGTTTLYFLAPKEVLDGKYPEAEHMTISVEYPTATPEARFAKVMFSPTKNGEDYDWFDADLRYEDIARLIDYGEKRCKFALGSTVVTSGVDERMKADKNFAAFVQMSLGRYINCDWGDTCEEDKRTNEGALRDGERLLAVYNYCKTGETIWIITEWDRSATTILFPSEY